MEYYRRILEADFNQRQRKNPHFSLRAYASFLGLASPVISEILRGKRRLPAKHGETVAQKLGLGPVEKELFLKSIKFSKKSLRDLSQVKSNKRTSQVVDEQRNYNMIAQWEYFALLSLLETEGFSNDDEWIARRLMITPQRVKQVRRELFEGQFIEEVDGHLKRSCGVLNTTQDISSQALKQSHLDTLEMAKSKLELTPVQERFYSSSTMALNTKRLEEAKKLIREFREKLCLLLEEDPQGTNEVYTFNIQLFPLSNLEMTHTNKEKS